MKIQVRIRTPNGQSRLEIEDESSLGDLVALIKEKTALQNFSLKYGYPLKNLDISLESQRTTHVKDHGLRGETVVVAPIETTPPAQEAPPPPKPFTPKGIEPDETSLAWPERGGHIGIFLNITHSYPNLT